MRFRSASCFALALTLSLGLAGCNTTSGPTETGGWGSFFGDPSTNVSGSEANTAISVLVNNELGNALEPSDRKAAVDAQGRALRAKGLGVSVAWQNERTGRSGQVRPGPFYFVNETRCREFTHEMVSKGKTLQARGTACETGRGTWQVIG